MFPSGSQAPVALAQLVDIRRLCRFEKMRTSVAQIAAFVLSLVFVAVSSRSTQAQGTFQNLDFENANIVFVSGSFVNVGASNALPGWLAFEGTNQLSTVGYNDPAVVVTTGLVGSNSWVIDGNFSASITGNESISQTGVLPSGTESLLFEASSSSLLVSLGSQNLSYTAISNALNSYSESYIIYAANISAFAGQTETLTFSSPTATYGILDDIQFSPEAVPEPSAASLIFLSSGILFYVRKRRQFRVNRF